MLSPSPNGFVSILGSNGVTHKTPPSSSYTYPVLLPDIFEGQPQIYWQNLQCQSNSLWQVVLRGCPNVHCIQGIMSGNKLKWVQIPSSILEGPEYSWTATRWAGGMQGFPCPESGRFDGTSKWLLGSTCMVLNNSLSTVSYPNPPTMAIQSSRVSHTKTS